MAAPSSFGLASGPRNAIVLYEEQFLDPGHRFTTAQLSPAPPGSQHVTWSVSNASVSVDDTAAIAALGGLVASPPPNGVAIVGETPGTATLTGSIDGVAGASASIPVDYYSSLDFGCDLRATATFQVPGGPVITRSNYSDAYMTGPAMPGNPAPCGNDPYLATPAGSDYVWNFPFGATLTDDGDDPSRPIATGVGRAPFFPSIPAGMWTNSFTSISATNLSQLAFPCGSQTCATQGASVVLFKTSGNLIVKFDFSQLINGAESAIGPYQISGPGPGFAY